MKSAPSVPLVFVDAAHVRQGGREWLYFAGNNYLGLAQDAGVLGAMRESLGDGCVQPGASRGTTGEAREYLEAERDLARFFRQPAAVLVPCGYVAPLAAFQALRGQSTHAVLDERVHACVKDAAAASGLPAVFFAHADATALRGAVRGLGRGARPVVATEGAYATRGGMAPLDAFLGALPSRGWLLVDDAHGVGAVGPGGRGAVAWHGLSDPRIVQTLSLAKAIGVGGGAVLGAVGVLSRLRAEAAAFVGTTSMPLAVVAGVRAALRRVRTETWRVRHLQALSARLHARWPAGVGASSHPDTPVKILIPESPVRARRLTQALRQAGIFPPLIRYLGGPPGGFFRFTVNAAHTEADVDRLADAVRAGWVVGKGNRRG